MIPIYKRMSDAHLIKRMEKGKIQMNVYTVLFGHGVRKQFLLVNISYMEQPHQLLLSSMKVPFSYLKLWNV